MITPRLRPWKVAVAPTSRRFILAVNGFDNANEAVATPVCTISIGNVRDVPVIRFWCKAGIVTGESLIWERADCSDWICVEPDVPNIVVSEFTPCRKFWSKA